MCLTAAVVIASTFLASSARNDEDSYTAAQNAQKAAERYSRQQKEKEWQAALAYNRRLASHPQNLGDPLGPGGSSVGFRGDSEYRSFLNAPGDVMAVITIPRLQLRLTVHHGCENYVLQDALGHLPGTSLPVGGKSSRVVIVGHRGLPGHTLFTYLPSLENGDLVFLTVLGKTLAYRVHGRQIVKPTDTKALEIQPGKDMISLLTCTPYGINTNRLIINAYRTKWPLGGMAPEVRSPLWFYIPILLFLFLLVLALIAYNVSRYRRRVAALHAVGRSAHGWFLPRRRDAVPSQANSKNGSGRASRSNRPYQSNRPN